MRVVIPVAGIGTRLRPLTDHVPKVLLPVAGRPILGHILASLAPARPSDVRLVVGYRADQVRAYATEAFDLPFTFVVQDEQRGLGHAVLQALDPAHDDEPLLVLLGDTIFDLDFAALARRRGNVLGVRAVDDPRRFGIAVVADGRVTRLVEKPTEPIGDLALVGVYRLERAGDLRRAIETLIERAITTRGEFQLTDALQVMVEEGAAFETFDVEDWFDCGTPEILLETNRILLERAERRDGERPSPSGARLVGPVHIGAGVALEEAELGPYAAVGDGSVVRRSTVRDAIVGRGATIRDAIVEAAIVGDGAHVSGGRVTGMVAPPTAAEEVSAT